MKYVTSIFFSFAFLCASLLAFAQPTFSISDYIADVATGKAVGLANIVLKIDSQFSSSTLADLDGKFLLTNVAAGSYNLYISMLGYEEKVVPLVVTSDKNLGNISLTVSSKLLNEVAVTANKPLLTRTSGKIVFNVALSPTHQTGTAEDALRNMPGITLDQKGDISLSGKKGVVVLIDGKPPAMAETNLQAFLKSIPANTLESIEIISHPSARYDAEGNAGFVNLKIKKGHANGLNGNNHLQEYPKYRARKQSFLQPMGRS